MTQHTAIPNPGLGTFRLKGDTLKSAVKNALDLGYRHIDTAQMYGNEAEVGQAIAESSVPRDEIFLTTKVWHDTLEPDDLKKSVDESLDKLGTDYVDLLLLHWPNPEISLKETLGALNEVQERGLARNIGISNFTSALIE